MNDLFTSRRLRLKFWQGVVLVLAETVVIWTVMVWLGNWILWLLKALSSLSEPWDTITVFLLGTAAVWLVFALVTVVVLFIAWLVMSAWLMSLIQNQGS